MLPKEKRIPRELFGELLTRSRYTNSAHFTLRFRLLDSCQTKIGVSVSKKISKKAVIRNKVRRRTYSIARTLDFPQGLFLFVAKTGAEKVVGDDLRTELASLVQGI